MSSIRKDYFRELRKRIATNNYRVMSKKEEINERFYLLGSKRLTADEYNVLVCNAKRIESSEVFISNPLMQLIPDKTEYARLDSNEKLRYLLELSSLFLQIKNSKTNGISN